MIKLYTAVIRPQLECATEVWDPHLQKNVELLEKALRMCSRQWDLSYHRISFVPSSVSVWNHLPSEALHATTVHTFKLFTVPLFM